MNNEETIIQSQPSTKKAADIQSSVVNKPSEVKEKKGVAWKHVTLGGVSGILMGAGLLYAGQLSARELESDEPVDDGATSYTAENGLRVAEVDQNLSFGEAFEAARAEVGPGGVFQWHGGLYNTFTADEWENMTPEERSDFAQLISPEIAPEDIVTPTDEYPNIALDTSADEMLSGDGLSADDGVYSDGVVLAGLPDDESEDGVEIVSKEEIEAGFGGEDVHIVGYDHVEGHLTVGYDLDGDGQADVAVIDVDDSRSLTAEDLIIDREGRSVTVEEAQNSQNQENTVSEDSGYSQMASMENPEVAPDMPDYMNDAMIDA